MVTENDIISIIADYVFLDAEEISRSQPINIYGIDSLEIYDLSLILEEEYDVEIYIKDIDFGTEQVREVTVQEFASKVADYINEAKK